MDRVHESTTGPPVIFEDESYQRSKQILGYLNGRNCGQLLSSGLWAPPFILHLFKFFLIPCDQYNGFIKSGEGVTIFEGNRKSGSFFCLRFG